MLGNVIICLTSLIYIQYDHIHELVALPDQMRKLPTLQSRNSKSEIMTRISRGQVLRLNAYRRLLYAYNTPQYFARVRLPDI